MLFYFTGTGNSLYVARQIEEKPISIPQILHQENLNFKDEKIGIVYPVYAYRFIRTCICIAAPASAHG